VWEVLLVPLTHLLPDPYLILILSILTNFEGQRAWFVLLDMLSDRFEACSFWSDFDGFAEVQV